MKCSPDKKIVIADRRILVLRQKHVRQERSPRALGYVFIDTGAMYRAVTLYGLRHGAVHGRGRSTRSAARSRCCPEIEHHRSSFNSERGKRAISSSNGENVEKRIRSIEVSEAWSAKSAGIGCRTRATRPAVNSNWDGRQGNRDGRTRYRHRRIPGRRAENLHDGRPGRSARIRRYTRAGRPKAKKCRWKRSSGTCASGTIADQTRADQPAAVRLADAVVLDNSRMTPEEQMEWIRPYVESRSQATCTSK